MIDFFIKNRTAAFGIIAFLFSLIPEACFTYTCAIKNFIEQCGCFVNLLACLNIEDIEDVQKVAQNINIIILRLILAFVVFIVVFVLQWILLKVRKSITIKGYNYFIVVEYGDIFKKKGCKKVINFDECFTTHVGDTLTEEIDSNSICGQYLPSHPELNIEQLIAARKIQPALSRSKYQNKIRYESGTIIPYGDDLLMAFAPLNSKGKAQFSSRDDYLSCLKLLWEELENYYSEKDVCIPVLGAGTTSFEGISGTSISQQDLLDLIICSYKLSSHKIKAPHALRIICRKNIGFSINNISS